MGIAVYNTSSLAHVSKYEVTWLSAHEYTGINSNLYTGDTTIAENWHGSRSYHS